MIKHSFAVCAYGDSPYLERCLRSLKAQTAPSELLICTSTPSPFISGLAEKYGIPLVVRDGTSGIGADWNFAFDAAKGHYVTLDLVCRKVSNASALLSSFRMCSCSSRLSFSGSRSGSGVSRTGQR